ncbi:hypothetical protein MCERE19_03005 [Spirosomataceae bacterium]|jgi:uncharacterized protein YjbJ (UPF0337 family)
MSDYSDLKGNWEETRTKLVKLFDSLAEEDLTYTDGNQEELWAKIQFKVGKTKSEIQYILSGL